MSPNRNVGRQGHTPDLIVLHTTGNTTQSAINTVLNPTSAVSYHFIVSRTGDVTQTVEITDTAWANGTNNTAGDGRNNQNSTLPIVRQRRINANLYTVSIGFGDMPTGNPSEAQLATVVNLIQHIRGEVLRLFRHDIAITRTTIVGHNVITPVTKPDCPGRTFPWGELFSRLSPAAPPSPIEPVPGLSHWAREAWEWATTNRITDGTNPQGTPSREQMVTLLHNYHMNVRR